MFEDEGLERYVMHQLELEDQPFTPGVAFPFVKVTDLAFVKRCSTSTFTKLPDLKPLPPSPPVRNLMLFCNSILYGTAWFTIPATNTQVCAYSW